MSKKKTKKAPAKAARKPRDPSALSVRFMVRCSPAELAAYEAEAERRGFRRGPFDTGVGMLVRSVLNARRGVPPGEHVIGPAGEILATKPQMPYPSVEAEGAGDPDGRDGRGLL